MKAVVYHRYGPPDVLEFQEIEKPTPGDDEVLIKVRAAAVNPLDRVFRGSWFLVRLLATGLRRPKNPRIGSDLSGEVEAVGSDVTQFKAGDAVFGVARGAFAEYTCALESKVAMKPKTIAFEQAAAVPVAGLTALQGLRDTGKIQPRQKVLINGAAGGVGTFAVQIAKSFGADVTGVCSTRNVDMVRSIGADQVIDYARDDFTKGAQRYDLILDCVGNRALLSCRRVLKPAGVFVMAGAPGKMWKVLARALGAFVLTRLVSQTFVLLMAKITKQDLTVMAELMEAGKVTPVIDRRYRLNEVPDALRYLEEGHARGKIVIALA